MLQQLLSELLLKIYDVTLCLRATWYCTYVRGVVKDVVLQSQVSQSAKLLNGKLTVLSLVDHSKRFYTSSRIYTAVVQATHRWMHRRVQRLAQGHFNMWPQGSWELNCWPSDSSWATAALCKCCVCFLFSFSFSFICISPVHNKRHLKVLWS